MKPRNTRLMTAKLRKHENENLITQSNHQLWDNIYIKCYKYNELSNESQYIIFNFTSGAIMFAKAKKKLQ